jgi:predicted phage-related endonuclease
MIPAEAPAAAKPPVDLKDRSTFLGGSDAAAVMSLSPWMTPVQLWEFKTHRAEKEQDVDEAREKRFARGKKLEPFIVEMTVDKLQDSGLVVELVKTNHVYVDAQYPFLACEIDFEMRLWGEVWINGEPVVFDGEHVNADAKSVTGFARKKWGEEGSEEVPVEYAAQFMHGLSVTGRKYCVVAALRSFDDVDIYWVVADDETIAAMRQKEVAFWNDHILADVPPDPLNFEDVKRVWPVATIDVLEVTEEVAEDAKRLKSIRAAKKLLEEQEEELQARIGRAIGAAATVMYGGKPLLTFNVERMTKFDRKGLQAAHPDICERFTQRGTHRVMRLK